MVADLGSIQAELNDPNLSILEKIGNGAFGTVYLAHDQQLKRDVAVKILHIRHLAENDTVRSRFLQEAKVLAALEHKNLLKVYGLRFSSRSRPYIKSEFLVGESLSSFIEKSKAIPLRKCLEIALQICEGMAYAEKHNVVHRDLKPENIFLCTQGSEQVAKVLDFGLCLDLSIDKELRDFKTTTGQLLGSPPYMSPEQCRGKRADSRSDIYSFGCILYEMLSGECLFKGDNVAEVILKHLSETPAFIETLFRDSGLPDQLSRLLLDCLQIDPGNRPQGFDEVHDRLMELHQSNCTGKFNLELLKPSKVVYRKTSSKARGLLILTAYVGMVFAVSDILLFFLNSQARSYQLRLMQALPADQQSTILNFCLDPLLQYGCKNQAEDLCIAFISSNRFRTLPAPRRCIITAFLLQKLENSCSDDSLEQIVLSLYGDLFDLYDYLPYRNVMEKTKALMRIPMEILMESVQSKKHQQAFWRRVLEMRLELPTTKRHWISGMSPQVYELQAMALRQRERKSAADFEKLIMSLLSQTHAYFHLYLSNPDAEPERKTDWLQHMDTTANEALSIIRTVDLEERLKSEVRITSRARAQAYLFLAASASLRNQAEPALKYLKLAHESDMETGGERRLLFRDLTTAPSWESLEEKIRDNLRKKEQGH